MSKPFKLSAVLYGHSLDVRSLCVTSNNSIVSGSRDKTARLWIPNSFNTGYTETTIYRDQKNFVASVLYLSESEQFPTGVVITGGNDNLILVYKLHEPFATFTFKDHTNTVCHLSKGVEPNTFISSSWDGSVKLWSLNNPGTALTTYTGHTAAVWSAIQLINGNVVTASADKTIGIFSKDGFRIHTIQGHSDCVRDILDLPELNSFVSVANDAHVKVWSYNGTNVSSYYGHTNYIYCIARNTAGGNNCFVTSDEDRTVRFWKDGVNTENIFLPAQSVWTVACLSNGDIVTGSSDGIVRIFTQDENRFANEQTLQAYDEEVQALAKHTTQEIGGIKVSDLPGKEALLEPGRTSGQMKMVREPQGVMAYTWVEEGENSHWEKVGDVLGGADPNADSKTTYEGKSYDFVFSVDVEDGKPPLTLPYNKGDDPYVSAHTFLETNMLPASYLETVVNFILTNSKEPEQALPSNSGFVDPFTGGSRYTPASGTTSTSVGSAGANLDPFTGDSSYSSGGGKPTSATASSGGNLKFFPQNEFRSFDAGNPPVILTKLKEFNMKTTNGQVDESVLDEVIKLCYQSSNHAVYEALFKLLSWTDDIVFPVIDIVRLALKQEESNRVIAQKEDGIILEKLKYYISEDCQVTNTTLVAFRALCNMCLHPPGVDLIFKNRVSLLESITGLSLGNKNIQVALTTFLLNITIVCQNHSDELGMQLLSSVIPDIVMHSNDSEAQFRGLVALGTLLSSTNYEHKVAVKLIINENKAFIEKLKGLTQEQSNDLDIKRNQCVGQILLALSSK